MVLDSLDQLHRVADSRFSDLISVASEVQVRMQSRARSSYAEPQPSLAMHLSNALQSYS